MMSQLPVQDAVYNLHAHPPGAEIEPYWGSFHLLDDLQIFYRAMDAVFRPATVDIQTMHYFPSFRSTIDEFVAQLPKDVGARIYTKIWEFNGSPMDGDTNWGYTHRFDNMTHLYVALKEAFLAPSLSQPPEEQSQALKVVSEATQLLIQALPSDIRANVFTRIWELDNRPEEFGYGELHAMEDLPRLLSVVGEQLVPTPISPAPTPDLTGTATPDNLDVQASNWLDLD